MTRISQALESKSSDLETRAPCWSPNLQIWKLGWRLKATVPKSEDLDSTPGFPNLKIWTPSLGSQLQLLYQKVPASELNSGHHYLNLTGLKDLFGLTLN